MSRRSAPPLVLRAFQQEAVARLSAALIDTAEKIRAAPDRRREIMRRIGCALLQAPTASGKTVMLAATAEAISERAPVAWLWFAPFRGVIEQTITSLRQAAPGLRVRDPRVDRFAAGTRPGDVFVATWAAVAARNAQSRRMRADDDMAPGLDTMVAQLRGAGLLLGAVVDEAHHTFRPGTEAFRFFAETLAPDMLMLASATPNDTDVERVRHELDITRFQRVSVSRDRVVAARLNKRAVRAVTFVAHGVNRGLLDLNEVALRKAVEQHRALKAALAKQGVPLVPLLLVQAASAAWTPPRVVKLLTEHLSFAATAVGVHTADEPDPDVQALARDPQVEVLVFKMAVATGFDAPRASTLCALRPVQDPGFGLQVIGRIMRVHPLLQPRTDLPEELDTGYVFLGDAEGQEGLQGAADRIRAIRDAIDVATDNVIVYQAAVDATGAISVDDGSGQHVLVLESPELQVVPIATQRAPGSPAPLALPPTTLFGSLAEAQAPAPRPDDHGPARPAGLRPAPLPAFRYEMRPGLPVPTRLRTEKMPRDTHILLDALVRNVTFTPEHLGWVRQQRVEVERRETDLFDAAKQRRTEEQATISDLFARENALRSLRVSDYLDPGVLARRLRDRLGAAIAAAGEDVPDLRKLGRGLNLILVRAPGVCRAALRRAMAAHTEVVDAADLPRTWDSAVPLLESALNLYGRIPGGLNTWEQAFARWLDRQEGRVIWWLRNPSRPTAADDWGVRIVLPEDGSGFYPDFVICVDGRKTRDHIGLADTKARIDDLPAEAKSRTQHREYGRALILTYDSARDRFTRIEFDPGLGRNKEVALLKPDDLVSE